jgi:hypothetical protein
VASAPRPALLACLLAAAALAAPPAGAPAREKPPAPDAEKPAPALRPPAGAVFVICEQIADALRIVPKAVVLTPEAYQKLVDELARLRDRTAADRALPPSRCHLKGKVEGNVLVLRAEFDLVADPPQTTVLLDCRQAVPNEIVLDDGRKPRLTRDDKDRMAVVVPAEKPGEAHRLALDLAVDVGPRDNGRGIERGLRLSLPRAAGTSVELELPGGIKDLLVNGRPPDDPLLEYKNGVLKGSLRGPPPEGRAEGVRGPADVLDLSWRPGGVAPGAAVLTATGLVRVRVDAGRLEADAELTLRSQGAPTREWRLLLPAGGDGRNVEVTPPPGAKLEKGAEDRQRRFAQYTLRLKEPAEQVKVGVKAAAPAPAGGRSAAVGPFLLAGATQQEGDVLVSNNPASGLRLDFPSLGHLTRQALTREDAPRDLVAAFRYANPPLPEKAPGATGAALLEVEAEAVRGVAEAAVRHALQLADDDQGRRWRVATTLTVTPVRAGVERLEVELPEGWAYDESVGARPAERVQAVESEGRRLRFQLLQPPRDPLQTFSLTFEAAYSGPRAGADEGALALPLPRPWPGTTLDRGADVTVRVPEDVELLPQPGATPHASGDDAAHTQAWHLLDRTPERLPVAWRPYRPEVRASGEVDLTLTPREGQVRHVLTYHFAGPPPRRVGLRVPQALADRIDASGARLGRSPSPGGEWSLALPASGDRHPRVVLSYSFPLPAEGADAVALKVPLVAPAGADRGETRVRVWSDPGRAPLAPGGAWSELAVESVDGHARLPALVLRAERPDPALTLGLGAAPAAGVLVERALVRADVSDSGGQAYRARFRLARLAARHLDVELPAPAAGLPGLAVTLDGRPVAAEVVDRDGRQADGGRVLRLRLAPDLVARPAVLEVRYELVQARPGFAALVTTLRPPAVLNCPGPVPTRWAVFLPAGWVPLAPEGGPGAGHAWTRRGWLPAPRPAATAADLERWFAGPDAPAPAPAAGGDAAPALVCWRDGFGPLAVTHAPQQGWLLGCSLAVLALALGLYLVARRPGPSGRVAPGAWLLPAVALAAVALAAAGLFWPGAVLAVLFGCTPGAAVVLLAAAVQGLRHARYRRRMAALPSFQRAPPGSAAGRDGSGQRLPALPEPSTVDVPRPEAPPALAPGNGSHPSQKVNAPGA